MTENESITKIAWAFAIAGLAGFINYLQRFTGDNPPKWAWLVVLVKVMTAGFVGLLTNWLMSKWQMGENYVDFAIAVAGYGGAETIAFFQQVFRDSIIRAAGVKSNDEPKS